MTGGQGDLAARGRTAVWLLSSCVCVTPLQDIQYTRMERVSNLPLPHPKVFPSYPLLVIIIQTLRQSPKPIYRISRSKEGTAFNPLPLPVGMQRRRSWRICWLKGGMRCVQVPDDRPYRRTAHSKLTPVLLYAWKVVV